MNGDMLKECVDGLSDAKRDRFFMLLAYAFEEWNDEYALEEQRIYEEFAKSFSEFKKFIEIEWHQAARGGDQKNEEMK
ncbi:hypothetical protein [Thiolapillus sp.]|uniref:hypothetical protein n=1 Tax=Thiolapillus sp. TaxID=2017437 RepID=UPI003AF8B21E